MRAVAGKDESGLRLILEGTSDSRDFRCLVIEVVVDFRLDRFRVTPVDHETVAHVVAVAADGGEQIGQIGGLGFGNHVLIGCEKFLETVFALRTHEEDLVFRLRSLRLSAVGIADDDVGIGAAEAKGVDTGIARVFRRQKVKPHRGNTDIEPLEVDLFIGLLGIERGREEVVFQRQHGLHQANQPRYGFGVPDIGLDRADGNRRITAPTDLGADGPDFRRIADLGAGSVTFNEGQT